MTRGKKKKQTKKSGDIRKEIRHLGVIIEHVDDKVGLIAEQYGDIKKTLDGHTETLNSHTETLNSHTETLNSHTEMIGKLVIDMEIVKNDVEFIKHGMKKKVDVDEFAALERRVALLEKRR